MTALVAVAALLALAATVERARRPASFLVLDLQGDGVYLSDVFYPVRFDVDGDGAPESMAWTALDCNDGFLWLDGNGNGVVDDGTELFGSSSTSRTCFEQLAALDAGDGDADGLLSPDDSVWSRLGVWVDRDQNGRSTPDELASLEDRGVIRIELGYRPQDRTDGTLNRVVAESTFQQIDRAVTDERQTVQRRVLEVRFRHAGTSSLGVPASRPAAAHPGDPSQSTRASALAQTTQEVIP